MSRAFARILCSEINRSRTTSHHEIFLPYASMLKMRVLTAAQLGTRARPPRRTNPASRLLSVSGAQEIQEEPRSHAVRSHGLRGCREATPKSLIFNISTPRYKHNLSWCGLLPRHPWTIYASTPVAGARTRLRAMSAWDIWRLRVLHQRDVDTAHELMGLDSPRRGLHGWIGHESMPVQPTFAWFSIESPHNPVWVPSDLMHRVSESSCRR